MQQGTIRKCSFRIGRFSLSTYFHLSLLPPLSPSLHLSILPSLSLPIPLSPPLSPYPLSQSLFQAGRDGLFLPLPPQSQDSPLYSFTNIHHRLDALLKDMNVESLQEMGIRVKSLPFAISCLFSVNAKKENMIRRLEKEKKRLIQSEVVSLEYEIEQERRRLSVAVAEELELKKTRAHVRFRERNIDKLTSIDGGTCVFFFVSLYFACCFLVCCPHRTSHCDCRP